MTRYSGSRGIMYTAPPGTESEDEAAETADAEAEADATEPSPADD